MTRKESRYCLEEYEKIKKELNRLMRNGNACWRSFIIAGKKQEVKHINSKDKDKERVIIAALKVEGYGIHGFDHYLEELGGLVEAAGGQVIATLVQARRQVESATYLGRGKVEELKHLVQELEPDTVVFDRELSPVQLRNLEQLLDIKILDRTILILDILPESKIRESASGRIGHATISFASLARKWNPTKPPGRRNWHPGSRRTETGTGSPLY